MPIVTLHKFLVVDDNSENRFFVTKTLLRKFPRAIVQECQDAEAAQIAVRSEKLSALVVHRSSEMDGLTLIKQLRHLNPTVPIVMVSGRESCPEALEAGANAFLNYDAWLRIGTLVEEILAANGTLNGSLSKRAPDAELTA